MRIAITGGTGFVGGHLAVALTAQGHEVVLLARGVDRRPWAREVTALHGVRLVSGNIHDEAALTGAFRGCDAVAHCAGINLERGEQTFERVHVHGTTNVLRAAEQAGVRRLAILSFLRARPDCGSPYHETKWAAEEMVRQSRLEWTVLKPGMMFGRGDHMLDHLSRALRTFPVFVGMGHRRVRPLAVTDAVTIAIAALVEGRFQRKTIGLVGPTMLEFNEAVRRVAAVLKRRPIIVNQPIAVTYALAWLAERVMVTPLISIAQVRILAEEAVAPAGATDALPSELVPSTPFNADTIQAGLPQEDGFRLTDVRFFRRPANRPPPESGL